MTLGEVGNGVDFSEILSNIALSVKSGNITFGVKLNSPKQMEASICVSTEDLMQEDPEIEASISVEVKFTITIPDNSNDEFNAEEFATAALKVVAAVAVAAAICFVAVTGVGAFIEFLTSGGFLLLGLA